jgi:hypothetical protein
MPVSARSPNRATAACCSACESDSLETCTRPAISGSATFWSDLRAIAPPVLFMRTKRERQEEEVVRRESEKVTEYYKIVNQMTTILIIKTGGVIAEQNEARPKRSQIIQIHSCRRSCESL